MLVLFGCCVALVQSFTQKSPPCTGLLATCSRGPDFQGARHGKGSICTKSLCLGCLRTAGPRVLNRLGVYTSSSNRSTVFNTDTRIYNYINFQLSAVQLSGWVQSSASGWVQASKGLSQPQPSSLVDTITAVGSHSQLRTLIRLTI